MKLRVVAGLVAAGSLVCVFPAESLAQAGCAPTPGVPGCGGCSCQGCVCGGDPYCCDTEWDDLCVDECADCGGCGGVDPGGGPCGNVTYEGCCDGQTVKYCEGGQLQTLDCSQNPACGWSQGNGYYDCGSAGTPDPSGLNPLSCQGGSGPYCGNGTCEAGENQAICPADCGGASPVCGNGVCENGESQASCPTDCTNSSPVCGNGKCEAGENQSVCPADCGNPGCSCTGKECGPDGCGGQCGSCQPGNFCDYTGKCVSIDGECTPNCDGKQCGSDGCKGECGTCPAQLICSGEGLCVSPYTQGDVVAESDAECTPSCQGKACGSDGCGGSCGSCSEGSGCNKEFMCEEGYVPPKNEEEEEEEENPYACKKGTSLKYGKCVPDAGSVEVDSSGCSVGRTAVSAGLVLLLGLLLSLVTALRAGRKQAL